MQKDQIVSMIESCIKMGSPQLDQTIISLIAVLYKNNALDHDNGVWYVDAGNKRITIAHPEEIKNTGQAIEIMDKPMKFDFKNLFIRGKPPNEKEKVQEAKIRDECVPPIEDEPKLSSKDLKEADVTDEDDLEFL